MFRTEASNIAEREDQGSSVWLRWVGGWDLLVYLLLAFGLAASVPRAPGGIREAILIAAVTGSFALWYGYVGGVRKVWLRGTAWAVAFLAVEAGLWMWLVLIDPIDFGLFVWAGVGMLAHVCVRSVRWSIAVAAIFGSGIVLREMLEPGPEDASVIVSAVVASALIVLVSFLVESVTRRSEELRLLVGELEATRADLAMSEREAGMLAERHRLARDIHDTLAQGFTSIVMLLEAAEAELDSDLHRTRAHIDQARSTARGSLAEARSLVWALRPDRLIESTLTEAVQSLVDQLGEETPTRARLGVTGEPRQLTDVTEECLLRVAQEALANVRKHAAASIVIVTLSYLDGAVELEVRDDGIGFEPAIRTIGTGSAGGIGLQLMLERVVQLGGTRAVESSAGVGSSVIVRLPTPLAVSPGSGDAVAGRRE